MAELSPGYHRRLHACTSGLAMLLPALAERRRRKLAEALLREAEDGSEQAGLEFCHASSGFSWPEFGARVAELQFTGVRKAVLEGSVRFGAPADFLGRLRSPDWLELLPRALLPLSVPDYTAERNERLAALARAGWENEVFLFFCRALRARRPGAWEGLRLAGLEARARRVVAFCPSLSGSSKPIELRLDESLLEALVLRGEEFDEQGRPGRVVVEGDLNHSQMTIDWQRPRAVARVAMSGHTWEDGFTSHQFAEEDSANRQEESWEAFLSHSLISLALLDRRR